jgi:aspartate ammonia-lyase
MAAEAGQLQLNAFEPIIARSLFDSVGQLTAACGVLATRCVRGITPNIATMAGHVDVSIGLATALNPFLGYAKASEIAREALATDRGVADIALERGYLSEAQLRHLLAPERLANLSLEANPDVGDLAVNST